MSAPLISLNMPYSRACAIIVSMLLQVKLWDIPADGISGSLSSPTATFGPMEVRWGRGRERETKGEERQRRGEERQRRGEEGVEGDGEGGEVRKAEGKEGEGKERVC